MKCCFFGHRDVEENIEPMLMKSIEELIEIGVTDFYVGNQGAFDKMVYRTLEKISNENKKIRVSVVLAYLPTQENVYKNTIYPEGLECVPKKFAISHRNKWMIEHSDYVISYVTRTFGGASQFCELARKKGKEIINIANLVKYDLVNRT